MAVACEQGRSLSQLLPKVKELRGVPGRMEFISRGQNFMVIVDYAYDPVAMAELYTTLKLLPWKRMIQVLGGSGGGRDQARQEVLGKMAG